MVQQGLGDEKDDAHLSGESRKSCDSGQMTGCVMLALLLHNGLGIAQDDNAALALFHKACDGGAILGCMYLGGAYSYGTGVAKDDVQAASYYGRRATAATRRAVRRWDLRIRTASA